MTEPCVVHTPYADLENGPSPHDIPWEPTQEDLIDELVTHLKGECDIDCQYGLCYEEYQIRTLPGGIEDVNLEDDYTERMIATSCTCDQHPYGHQS
jgi:hypothetical protein